MILFNSHEDVNETVLSNEVRTSLADAALISLDVAGKYSDCVGDHLQ